MQVCRVLSQVTKWHAAGHEVADHTVTHGATTYAEVVGMLAWNVYTGVQVDQIKGYRSPLRNFTVDGLSLLSKMGDLSFLYRLPL